jgi:thiamine transport system ATP-binding protein
VRGTTFRRGRSEVGVDVPGLGPVTAVAEGVPSLEPGATVGLGVDTAFVAVLPA